MQDLKVLATVVAEIARVDLKSVSHGSLIYICRSRSLGQGAW